MALTYSHIYFCKEGVVHANGWRVREMNVHTWRSPRRACGILGRVVSFSRQQPRFTSRPMLPCGSVNLFWLDLMIVQRKSETQRSRGEKFSKKGRKYFMESEVSSRKYLGVSSTASGNLWGFIRVLSNNFRASVDLRCFTFGPSKSHLTFGLPSVGSSL